MMKKAKFLIPIAALGLLLTSCGNSSLPLHYDPNDTTVHEDWKDYLIPVESISFSNAEQNVSLLEGQTHKYEFTYSPKRATTNYLSFVSQNENVATVSKVGHDFVLNAVHAGKTTVVVSGGEDAKFDPVTLNVRVDVGLSDFDLEDDSVSLDYGEQYQIGFVFDPENTTQTEMSYVSNDETIATVSEDGLVTASTKTGSTKIIVTSAHINKSAELTVNVENKYEYLSKFELSSSSNRVEVGKTAQLSLDVLPEDHSADLSKVSYVVEDEEVLSISREGVVTANKVGKTKVKATVEERYAEGHAGVKESNEIEIEVFEVKISSISLTNKDKEVIPEGDKVYLDNSSVEKQSFKFDCVYDTDDTQIKEPTFKTIAYSVEQEGNVVSITSEGLVTLMGPGEAIVTVEDKYSGEKDSVTVVCTVHAEKITITSTTLGGFNDEVVTVTVTTKPTKISDEIKWNISNEDKLNVTKGDYSLKVSAKEAGSYTISATDGVITSNEITLTFTKRPAEFDPDKYYIAGTANFSSGVSKAGEASWNDADYARAFNEVLPETEDIHYQTRATVHFNAGDEFKVRHRFNDSDYEEVNVWKEGATEPERHYENGGAILSGDVSVTSDAADANYHVNNEGTYRILFKVYNSGWRSTYIERYDFTVSKSLVALGQNEQETITAAHWTGKLTITKSSELITWEDDGNGNITIKSGDSTGDATLTLTDDLVSLVVNINVSKIERTPIYVNANARFDADESVLFLHAWDDKGYYDYKMNKVEGKGTVYEADINKAYKDVMFIRCAKGTTEIIYEGEGKNVYNKSAEQKVVDGKNMWTFTGYDENGVALGNWDNNYDPSKDYHDDRITQIYIQDEVEYPNPGGSDRWTMSGVDPVLHMWNITFDPLSPYQSVSELKAASVKIGYATSYNTERNEIDATFNWSEMKDGYKRCYIIEVPWYITSFKLCFYASKDGSDRYLYERHNEDSVQFDAVKGRNYQVYSFSTEDFTSYWDGSKFRSAITVASQSN